MMSWCRFGTLSCARFGMTQVLLDMRCIMCSLVRRKGWDGSSPDVGFGMPDVPVASDNAAMASTP